ncbi:MAG: IS200/IS605 family element transposase accessory protein TnpB [Candidatus Latescibacteria bacterium]|nr:IS200/IS605 family element transposase accessory protein TnpB [Candidatus Latescibacterota bacterium]
MNPTPEQEQYLRQACGVARFCFNWGLAEWKRQYEEGSKPSAYLLKKQFNTIRREQYPWSYDVTKCAVDTGFCNLDTAFRNFFRRCKHGDEAPGFPKFKSKKMSRPSLRMDGARVKIDGHWLKLERLDTPINMAEMLRFNGKIGSATISEDAGYWYASISVEVELPEHEHPQESVGVDLGVKTLAVLSDGMQFENQKLLRSELRKVKRLSRELSRRQEGSGRWQRAKKKLVKLNRRIADERLDYQHKMTTEIARTYKTVGVEDLNVAGMLRNHRLALSIADAGFREIRRQLTYKTEWYGGELIVIDRFLPSSRLCPICGAIKDDLPLNDRIFVCECGYTADRDLNAACNIEQAALRIVAGVGSPRLKTRVERVSDSSEQPAVKRENMAEERQPSRPAVI